MRRCLVVVVLGEVALEVEVLEVALEVVVLEVHQVVFEVDHFVLVVLHLAEQEPTELYHALLVVLIDITIIDHTIDIIGGVIDPGIIDGGILHGGQVIGIDHGTIVLCMLEEE
jgi:hypothetical protein